MLLVLWMALYWLTSYTLHAASSMARATAQAQQGHLGGVTDPYAAPE